MEHSVFFFFRLQYSYEHTGGHSGIIQLTVECIDCYRNNQLCDLPSARGHVVGSTHCLVMLFTTIPLGHSHPLTLQIRGQAISLLILSHLRVQLSGIAQRFLVWPLIGHSVGGSYDILTTWFLY